MILSQLTANDLANYLRLEQDDDDALLTGILAAAQSAVLNYTGVTADEADTLPELTLAALVVGADLYEHRTMQVDNNNINLTARSLMDLHRSNLI